MSYECVLCHPDEITMLIPKSSRWLSYRQYVIQYSSPESLADNRAPSNGGQAKCQDPSCTGKKQNEKLARCTVCYFVYHWQCVQGRDALAMPDLVAWVLADNRAPSNGGQAKCQDPSCTGKKQNEKSARCTVCYFVYHWRCVQLTVVQPNYVCAACTVKYL